jgi:hypothetical protein
MSIVQSAPALLIGILALVFTIFSFWWMNWRKGKLIVGPPRSYALVAPGEKELLIELPLIFYNNGAATQVIQNLRLKLEQNNKSTILNFNNTESDLGSSDSNRQWARQFAIEGRKAHSNIFAFNRKHGEFVPSQGKCKATLEGKLYENMEWKEMLIFDLNISGTPPFNCLLTYDNDLGKLESR